MVNMEELFANQLDTPLGVSTRKWDTLDTNMVNMKELFAHHLDTHLGLSTIKWDTLDTNKPNHVAQHSCRSQTVKHELSRSFLGRSSRISAW